MTSQLKNPTETANVADASNRLPAHSARIPSGRAVSFGGQTVPRPRSKIPAKGGDLSVRFARRLRELMEEHGWSSRDVAERVTGAGVPIGDRGIDAWLRGQRLPKLKDLERVGTALALADYRDLLPEPAGKPKARSG
jgi:hypothetical protein